MIKPTRSWHEWTPPRTNEQKKTEWKKQKNTNQHTNERTLAVMTSGGLVDCCGLTHPNKWVHVCWLCFRNWLIWLLLSRALILDVWDAVGGHWWTSWWVWAISWSRAQRSRWMQAQIWPGIFSVLGICILCYRFGTSWHHIRMQNYIEWRKKTTFLSIGRHGTARGGVLDGKNQQIWLGANWIGGRTIRQLTRTGDCEPGSNVLLLFLLIIKKPCVSWFQVPLKA